ncbi:polysaccharide deacetylase family protein [Hymenobacter sp. YC55]|nr:polysaccharide deacetylase family protein [Hymenobacter sp. YC55]
MILVAVAQTSQRVFWLMVAWWLATASGAHAQVLRQPIPDKLVVLTFDDGVVSHATVVAPLLKKYGFGGTFYVCEFPPDFADKTKYMSWPQIQQLHQAGFEVASHTLTHRHVNKLTPAQFKTELDSIEKRCATYRIPKPTTFAYPGYDTHPASLAVLQAQGYQFARAGGRRAYDPTTDHPFLIPSFSTAIADKLDIKAVVQQARNGKIVVLTVHGVPDNAHDWVTTPPALFEEYLKYLHDNHYQVIALRDLARYVNVPEALRTLAPNYEHLK